MGSWYPAVLVTSNASTLLVIRQESTDVACALRRLKVSPGFSPPTNVRLRNVTYWTPEPTSALCRSRRPK